MLNNVRARISSVQIVREALLLWAANALPLVAMSAIMISTHKIFGAILYSTGPMQEALESGEIGGTTSFLFGIFVLFSFLVNCFLSLAALNMLRRKKDDRLSFPGVFKDAALRLPSFLKSLFCIWGFILTGVFVAVSFLAGGRLLYTLLSKSMGHGPALGALLATSTVFVVLVISVAWYGFFFSLAPLAAAYENMPAFGSLKASRDRVRGNALRYLAAVAIFVIAYFFVGLTAYSITIRFTQDRQILNLIDPVLLLFFGPLGLSVWYVSYKRLTELRA